MKILMFLTTQFGSWVKVFLTVICALITAEGEDFFTWDKKMIYKIIVATATAFGPMLINSNNPLYPLYGKRKDKDVVVVDKASGEEVAP